MLTDVRSSMSAIGVIQNGVQVEATLSRGMLRIAGSAFGGIMGFLLMMRVGLANNPYFLVVMMLVFVFLFGLLGPTDLSLAVVFVLNGLGGTIFCQYRYF